RRRRDQKPTPNGSQIPQPTIGGNVQQPQGQPQINLQRRPPPRTRARRSPTARAGSIRVLSASDAAPVGAPPSAAPPSAAPPGSGN
ncbi:MAG: hypothetical protein WDN30_06850, partial [Pararobbsia sp.]